LKELDVLIVGAGPAGLSAAMFLAKRGIASTVVEKEKFPRDKICGDALSGKVVEILNRLDKGLANEISGDTKFLGSWGVTFVAPGGQQLRVPFRHGNEGIIPPGFISKRMDFDNWLYAKATSYGCVEIRENTIIRDYKKTAEGITATSKDGSVFKARIIIAADGAYSSFAKEMAGIRTQPEHNCFGLRAYYKNVGGQNDGNFIELHFLKEILPCYFWIFPLPDGYCNVGIGVRADKAAAGKINLKRTFEDILENNATIKARFAQAERVGEIKLFGLPLGSKRRRLSGAHYILCGDAAQLIDPFTGEGIGNAMMSGMLAAEQAAECLACNDFSARCIVQYDKMLYRRVGDELKLSTVLARLVNYPWLFDYVVRKANSNHLLRETISCMFEDLDMRARLQSPLFYLKLIFS